MARVLVIGGGASGMVASLYASKNNEVILIDKNNSFGKKLLMTGNGKCNYWNTDISLKHYNSSNLDILDKIITDENKNEIVSFFDRLGIIPRIKDNLCYPYSNQATSIQTALILECELSGVEIVNNEEVINVVKNNDIFEVTTSNRKFNVDKVILATGSKAFPKTGSDGFGYKIAKSFGHDIIKPLPALVQLKVDASFLKEWQGVRTDVSVSLYENDLFLKREFGEIQLTDYGVSGICVFQLSSLASRGLYNSCKEELEINFLTGLSINDSDEFINFMNKRDKALVGRNVSQLLDGILNYKLINLILKLSKIDRYVLWDDIDDESKKILGNYFTKLRLTVIGTNGFECSQVCSGGVRLDEVNPNTMESFKEKGLYIVGELLDVDGECGGFNLGFAWITGYLAGKSVGEVND